MPHNSRFYPEYRLVCRLATLTSKPTKPSLNCKATLLLLSLVELFRTISPIFPMSHHIPNTTLSGHGIPSGVGDLVTIGAVANSLGWTVQGWLSHTQPCAVRPLPSSNKDVTQYTTRLLHYDRVKVMRQEVD